jgi:hypothetical protein
MLAENGLVCQQNHHYTLRAPFRDAGQITIAQAAQPYSLVNRYRDTVAPIRLTSSFGSHNQAGRLLCMLLLLALAVPGCVRRRMLIRSQPVGATVYVDDQEIGTTPVSTEFTYYGTRKIQLIKDGYETLTVQQMFFPPWYQFPVVEFISENLSPREHRDEHLLDFQLEPQRILPADELLERAQELRVNTSRGYSAALPYATSQPPGTAAPNLPGHSSLGTPPAVLSAPEAYHGSP